MPASIRRASEGAIGRIPNSSPAFMIASHRSSPREPSSRFTSNPGTAVHPVRLMTHRDPVDLEALAPVVADVVDRRADELLEGLGRHRPLDLHGMHVGQGDLGVEAAGREDAEGVQPGVGVGELHPPHVLLHMQQDGVVHDAPVGGRDDHVLPLLHRALREVATGESIDQPVGVGPAHLHGPLDADVPQRDRLVERPVLHIGIVVVPGQVHVVVDVVGGAPRPSCGVEERRAPVPRAEVQRRAVLQHLRAFVGHGSPFAPGCALRDGDPLRRIDERHRRHDRVARPPLRLDTHGLALVAAPCRQPAIADVGTKPRRVDSRGHLADGLAVDRGVPFHVVQRRGTGRRRTSRR